MTAIVTFNQTDGGGEIQVFLNRVGRHLTETRNQGAWVDLIYKDIDKDLAAKLSDEVFGYTTLALLSFKPRKKPKFTPSLVN